MAVVSNLRVKNTFVEVEDFFDDDTVYDSSFARQLSAPAAPFTRKVSYGVHAGPGQYAPELETLAEAVPPGPSDEPASVLLAGEMASLLGRRAGLGLGLGFSGLGLGEPVQLGSMSRFGGGMLQREAPTSVSTSAFNLEGSPQVLPPYGTSPGLGVEDPDDDPSIFGPMTPAYSPPSTSTTEGIWDVTTVMMRNLPNKYTRDMLMEELCEAGFAALFDFLYVPIDPETNANKGYAFINFTDNEASWRFKARFDGQQMIKFNSNKLVLVTKATLQGLDANYAHYQSARCNRGDVSSRPLFLRIPTAATKAQESSASHARRGGRHHRRRLARGRADGSEEPAGDSQGNDEQSFGMPFPPQPPMPQLQPQFPGGQQRQQQQQSQQPQYQQTNGQPSQMDADSGNHGVFCPFCGSGVQVDFKFCNACGATLKDIF